MKFICESHRDEILQNPAHAIKHWDVLMKHGLQLLDLGDCQKAIPLMGSSYEIGEWLLSKTEIQPSGNAPSHVDRYTLAGHHLVDCYRINGNQALELHVLLSVHRNLVLLASRQQTREWSVKANITASMYKLQRYIDFYGLFPGYLDLHEETQRVLRHFRN